MGSDKERGVALLVVLCLILILVIGATSFILISSSEIKLVRRQNDSTKAFYLAEAGLERARYDLEQDSDWQDGGINGITCGPGSASFYTLYGSTSLGNGTYSVKLKNIAENGGYKDDEIWIKSIGTYGNGVRTVLAKVESSQGLGGLTVDYAIETEGEINIQGNVTINPAGNTNPEATLDFEAAFGASKAEMEEIAEDNFPDTYYESAFSNDVADDGAGGPTLTWISAPGVESQITQNGWSGAGVFIVDGNLKITGGVFNGIIWVVGTLTISGNPVITGGLFVEGGVTVDTEISGTAIINRGTQAEVDIALSPLTSLSPIIKSWQEVAN